MMNAAVILTLAANLSGAPEFAGPAGLPVVPAAAETAALNRSGDAADDPAVWVHPVDGALSLVIGTDKQGGLGVYDLSGAVVQSLADGRMNNVDVAHGVRLADGSAADLVFASKRDDDTIAAYRVDAATRRLVPLEGGPFASGVSGVYGLCAYVENGAARVVTNSKDGTVVVTEFSASAAGRWETREIRRFCVGTQVEGCAVDVERGRMYVGEECLGVWSYPLHPEKLREEDAARTLLDTVSTIGSGRLARDVEGVTIYEAPGGGGWILVSCQAEDRFAVYSREQGRYVGSFRIAFTRADGTVDPVTHTDGISAISRPLGPEFPRGVLVVQDDNEGEKQNYKIIDWRKVSDALGLETPGR